jgi:hypothetical protein
VGQLEDRCSVPDPADARWDQNSSQRDDGQWRLAVEGNSGGVGRICSSERSS